MGKSAPSNTTTTTKQELDPWIKSQLTQNMGTARLLTSGMLPQYKPQAADGGGQPPGFYTGPGGFMGGGDPYAWQNDVALMGGGGANPNPTDYVNADGTPFKPPSTFTAGFDPLQTQAQNALVGIGNTSFNANQFGAAEAARMANFTAPTMTSASVANVTPFTAASIGNVNPYEAATIADARFKDLNFSDFMVPFKNEVLDPTKAYLDEMGKRALSTVIGANRVGSAVRGSGEDIKTALTMGEHNLQSGRLIGDLNKSMYETGMGAAQAELNRALQRNTAQAGLVQQARAADFAQRARQAELNAQFGQQSAAADFAQRGSQAVNNAQFAQQAGIVNNANAMAIPGMNLAGAQAGGQALLTARDTNINNNALIDTVGAQRRGLDQARLEDPFRALALQTQMTTGTLPGFMGQSTTGPSPYGSSGGLSGALGGGLAGGSLAMMLGPQGLNLLGASAGPVGWGLAGLGALAGALG